MKSKSLKTTCLRVLAVVVLVLSVLVLLPCNFEFFLCVFVREESALELNDYNRPIIEALLTDSEEAVPDIENAEKIEYLALMSKDKVTITYNDGTDHRFFTVGGSLISYLRENGYVVYFRSMESFVLALKAAIPTACFIASTVFLVKTKPKSAPKRYRFERVTK